MNGRSQEKNTSNLFPNNYYEKIRTVIEGVIIGIFYRWGAWPFEYGTYKRAAVENKDPLFKIYKDIFNRRKLLELNKSFMTTGFVQTVGRSMANIGVLHYVNCNYSHLSSIEKGLFAAALSAPLDTLVTTPGEAGKIRNFLELKPINKLFPSNVVQANFTRNLATGVITFVGIYKITELGIPFFPLSMAESPLVKGLLACFANIIIQPMNMPFINFQTYAVRNPDKPFVVAATSFCKEHTWRQMVKGADARIIHRAIFYGLSFGSSEYLKKKRQISQPINENREIENSPSSIFKKP